MRKHDLSSNEHTGEIDKDNLIIPKVTVISVYYNRKSNLLSSIQSIIDQSYNSFEYIIIDDGSTDGTDDLLETIKDPRIRFIRKKNSGFTSSMNYGISLARGDFIAVHGSGDIAHPERIESQMEVLERRPEVGVVGCFVRTVIGGDEVISARHAGDDFYARLKNDAIFTHGEVMYRRDLFHAVGGYREFFKYAQDYDLWFRMSRLCTYEIVPNILYTR
ncbi:MAG: glycosyltransferase, partial [Hyphomonas sp.]|nr:glycosyltransferase [Hyphomonas sp.]